MLLLKLKAESLQVVGGRRSDTGRLGAFITRVKSGSVADTVGRLRAGIYCYLLSLLPSY